MAEVKVTTRKNGAREVLVNGIAIPDVTDVTMYVCPDSIDEVTIRIHADSFQSEE